MTSQQFLQVIMSRGVVNEGEIKEIFAHFFGNHSLATQINMINRNLDPLQLAIKMSICEVTGEKYWVFTSTINPESAMPSFASAEFTKVELNYITEIFDRLVNADNCVLSTMDCLNFATELPDKLVPTHAEKIINKLIENHWLVLENGWLYMGARALADFMSRFTTHYKEILITCPLCKKTVFHGHPCGNCNIKFHLYCLKNFARLGAGLTCSGCKKELTNVRGIETDGDDSMEVPSDE